MCISPKKTDISKINHKEITLDISLPVENRLIYSITRVLEQSYKNSLSDDIEYKVKEKLRLDHVDKCDLIAKELYQLLGNNNIQVTFNR